MRWIDFWGAIGSFFEWIFRIMAKLDNLPNVFYWVVICISLAYWTLQIVKQNKEAARNGTYK